MNACLKGTYPYDVIKNDSSVSWIMNPSRTNGGVFGFARALVGRDPGSDVAFGNGYEGRVLFFPN
jgi:hypothetical protein